MTRILLIQGHPDNTQRHYGHALAEAYREGAVAAGHEVDVLDVAALDFSLLRSKEEFEQAPPPAIADAQQRLLLAEHVVIFYPLWLGGMPALLKGFLEQLLRPGFAFTPQAMSGRLKGRSARVVITMGMPALLYRWYFGAHGLRMLRRSILGLCGIAPVKASLIGNVEGNADARLHWLERLRQLGAGAG